MNKIIGQQIQKVPRLLLRKVLQRKLEEQNIHDDGLLEALTDHILSQSAEQFRWEDGSEGTDKNLTLTLTEEDSNNLINDYKNFVELKVPKLVRNVIKSGAKLQVKNLGKRWAELKINDFNEMRHFRDHLELRWASGLDVLRMLLIASREIGETFSQKLFRSKAKRGLVKREAIVLLHMRACQTTLEIVTLLENGLPDGAYARWRTLYEISVVAFVIDRFGDEIAERYLAHDLVSMREYIINEYKHEGRKYEPQSLEGEEKEIEEGFQRVIAEFGQSFAGPYGWSADSLSLKSPRFQDLEKAINWVALPPQYKWSSYKIHAGVAGTVRTLGFVGNNHFIHAGATNAGLETPAINTAFSLVHMTSLLFGKLNDIETQIHLRSLILLRDKVVKKCQKTARKLEQDELNFQKEL
ncbi:DUF5677 domain-containing protein [Phyllobacterium leguminum]|nr:DUF5677 domain-containing protein [Phyllobacterium leguminum]